MKPRLPREIELLLPPEICHEIYLYLTKHDSPSHSKPPSYQSSPQFMKDMTKIQHMKLRGKSPHFMKGLEDFILDSDCY
jgi:hypothetical protein